MRVDSFDWDRIRIFRAVAELGSMSAAAEKLGGSVPTISRRISELETALRTELVKRSSRGIDLTDAGHMLLRHANLMADIVSAAHDDVCDTDTPNEGPVHLVTGDGLGPYWLARRIPQFLASYPGIELTLSISDRPPDLLNNEADIAIQFEPPNRSELIGRRMGVVHYLCFASRGYLDLHGIPTSLTDFHHHRCLLHEGYVNQSGHWAEDAFLARQLIPFSLITNSSATLIACCQAGGGIAILPSYIGAAYPELVPLALPEMASTQFWMTYTERVRRITRGQVVVEWLRKAFDPTESDWFRANLTRPEFTPAGE
ncbi:MAG: LysR family transcriptional regulator [Alphaproteobacteria bacterium]|nr:LysR family transcriptional regulator [Alphaproteobacteria bacterium]